MEQDSQHGAHAGVIWARKELEVEEGSADTTGGVGSVLRASPGLGLVGLGADSTSFG